MTACLCKDCHEPVMPFGLAYGGIAIVDAEPDARGSHVLVGRMLLELVPDGEPAPHASGRINRSKALGLMRYTLHDRTCSKAMRPSRALPEEQKKTTPTPIRERSRYGR